VDARRSAEQQTPKKRGARNPGTTRSQKQAGVHPTNGHPDAQLKKVATRLKRRTNGRPKGGPPDISEQSSPTPRQPGPVGRVLRNNGPGRQPPTPFERRGGRVVAGLPRGRPS